MLNGKARRHGTRPTSRFQLRQFCLIHLALLSTRRKISQNVKENYFAGENVPTASSPKPMLHDSTRGNNMLNWNQLRREKTSCQSNNETDPDSAFWSNTLDCITQPWGQCTRRDLYHTILLYYYNGQQRDNLRISEFERSCVQLMASY